MEHTLTDAHADARSLTDTLTHFTDTHPLTDAHTDSHTLSEHTLTDTQMHTHSQTH